MMEEIGEDKIMIAQGGGISNNISLLSKIFSSSWSSTENEEEKNYYLDLDYPKDSKECLKYLLDGSLSAHSLN